MKIHSSPVSYEGYVRQLQQQALPQLPPTSGSNFMAQYGADTFVPATPQQPAAPQLTRDQKLGMLRELGIKEKHLGKASDAQMDSIISKFQQALSTPGKKEFTIKVGKKKYKVKMEVGPDGQLKSLSVKQKKGFFSKLGGFLKKVGGVALKIASFIPGPIGIAARIGQTVMTAVSSIKNGDFLGAIKGVAGNFIPGANKLPM